MNVQSILDRHTRVRAMIDAYSGFVACTLRKADVPPADIDDQMQCAFIVAARRIDDIQIGAERAFLFRVAMHLASHVHRSLARRRETLCDEVPDAIEFRATPDELLDRMQIRKRVDDVVDQLDESIRSVFTLFALEEMNLGEIAVSLGIPRGTAASRLRRARAQLQERLGEIELTSTIGAHRTGRSEEPPSLRHEKLSALERALLGVGACVPSWASMRAKTLGILGLDEAIRL